jgi:hypothetical protein
MRITGYRLAIRRRARGGDPGPSRWRQAAKWLAGGAIAALAPLIVVSETSLKALYERWFDDCRVVIETGPWQPPAKGSVIVVPVRLYPSGASPETLRVAFSTPEAVLREVRLQRDLDADNLAIHPDAGYPCPHEICAEDPVCLVKDADSEACTYADIKVKLDPFRTVFQYPFQVTMAVPAGRDPAAVAGSLQVYLHYTKDALGGPQAAACRAEAASFFNLLARVADWQKFLIIAIAVFLLVAIVAALKESAPR